VQVKQEGVRLLFAQLNQGSATGELRATGLTLPGIECSEGAKR
jgi:hypothetical protein